MYAHIIPISEVGEKTPKTQNRSNWDAAHCEGKFGNIWMARKMKRRRVLEWNGGGKEQK